MCELCAAENGNIERMMMKEKEVAATPAARKKKVLVRKLGFVSRAQQLLSLAQCNFCYCCKYILWVFVLLYTQLADDKYRNGH